MFLWKVQDLWDLMQQLRNNYFFGIILTRGTIGKETASWVCIVAAAPLAAAGFFRYNGLTFEQFAWAFIKSQILCAGPRVFRSENLYCKILSEKEKNIYD